MIRCQTELFPRSLGVIGAKPSRLVYAASGKSSRNSACRLFSSNPWQAKKFFESMGRTSRLNCRTGASEYAEAFSPIATQKRLNKRRNGVVVSIVLISLRMECWLSKGLIPIDPLPQIMVTRQRCANFPLQHLVMIL